MNKEWEFPACRQTGSLPPSAVQKSHAYDLMGTRSFLVVLVITERGILFFGEVAELAEGNRLLSGCRG